MRGQLSCGSIYSDIALLPKFNQFHDIYDFDYYVTNKMDPQTDPQSVWRSGT